MATLNHMQVEPVTSEEYIQLTVGFSNHLYQQLSFKKGGSPAAVAAEFRELANRILEHDNLKG